MNIAIILAAGSGERMKSDVSKQFILVNDLPLFMYSIKAFNQNRSIDSIFVVTKEEDLDAVKAECKKHKILKFRNVIPGGATRQESVYNALKYLKGKTNGDDNILIHDSARPLVSQDIINSNLNALNECDAVETAVKATDTIIKSDDGQSINQVENRETIFQVQTPQSFKYSIILKAHQKAREDGFIGTDDAGLVLRMNHPVHIVLGNKNNFKVTNPEDLDLLIAIIKKGELE